MRPTLLDGDLVLIRQWGRRRRLARPGAVVLIEDPRERTRLLLKRVESVSAGGVFLRGDDPNRSTDSRHFGLVPLSHMRGRVVRDRRAGGRRYHRFVPASLDVILGPDYLAGMVELPVETLRERRRECQAVESGLSLVRRLAQGRLDIVEANRSRRAAAAASLDLEHLIAQLPAILSDHATSTGRGSLLDTAVPPEDIDGLVAELDGIVGPTALSALSELSEEALDQLYDALTAFEQAISTQRHGVHERIDALEHEMVLRYQRGEASVETLLH